MSAYQKRIEQLKQKFGLSNGLQLEGQEIPKAKSVQDVVNNREKQASEQCGYQTSFGHVTHRGEEIALAIRVRI